MMKGGLIQQACLVRLKPKSSSMEGKAWHRYRRYAAARQFRIRDKPLWNNTGRFFHAAVTRTKNIKKYYGDRLILNIEDLKIYSGDRIGVVGLNGAGKTTLMEILAGNITLMKEL